MSHAPSRASRAGDGDGDGDGERDGHGQHRGEAPVPTDRRGRLAGARPWGRHATEAAAGAGLFALSWLLLADRTDTVPGWEADVFEVANGLPGPLGWPLWPVMQLGTVGMGLVVAAVVYALTRRWHPTLAIASAVLLAWVTAKVIKEAIQRGRPDDLLDGVDLRSSHYSGFGYVSGHTTVAFALATVLTPVLPGRWRWVPLPLAAVVGFSRMFFGAHFPLDVMGGAGLGILCGLVASLAFGTIDIRSRSAGSPEPPG
jgi:membrane-associated phospholipid phosphatase